MKIKLISFLLFFSSCRTTCHFISDGIATRDSGEYTVKGCIECKGKLEKVTNVKFLNAKKIK